LAGIRIPKRHGYYHCARGHKYIGINKAEFESIVANTLNQLRAKPGFLPLFREVVRDVWIQKNRLAVDTRKQVDTHIVELKHRQATLVDAIANSRSSIVREKLEQQVEELESSIHAAEQERPKGRIREDEIDAYCAIAKNLMEHPTTSVMSAPTKEKIEKLWSFIFNASPTYADLTDGTPDLTLIYRFNRDFGSNKKLLAGELSLQWNTWEDEAMTVIRL
jgi:predicted DNA-binding protein